MLIKLKLSIKSRHVESAIVLQLIQTRLRLTTRIHGVTYLQIQLISMQFIHHRRLICNKQEHQCLRVSYFRKFTMDTNACTNISCKSIEYRNILENLMLPSNSCDERHEPVTMVTDLMMTLSCTGKQYSEKKALLCYYTVSSSIDDCVVRITSTRV